MPLPDFESLSKYEFFKKVGYESHRAQAVYHNSKARFRVPTCGRRWGKSTAVGHNMSFACLRPNSWYWICGPTYKLAEKEFRVVHRDFVMELGLRKYLKVSYNAKQGDMRIEFPWNTVLECTSATNQDSLLGEGLDGIIMSEAARHSQETWEMYIQPALSDKQGWADFPSTPRGFNWYQGLWALGQHAEMPEYESWRFPTWTNTVQYPGGMENLELQRIMATVSPGYWKQEYAAEFTSFEGQIYEEFDPQIHVRKIDYVPGWRNYLVFDYGFNDPFVCLDIMVDPSDNVYVWREYQVRYKTTWEHAHAIKERENPPHYHIDAMFGDPRGADEAATIALVLGHVTGRDVGWISGIEAVKRKLKIQPNGKPQMFFDPSCYQTIRQMQALRHREIKEGHNAREGQVDYDDHGPDALRYFISEFFVLGAGMSLSDIYDQPHLGSEAETFFRLHSSITLDTPVGY